MNQKWIDRLERKFGKYSIHGLMKYIVAIELVGALIGIINPEIYYNYFMLDYSMIAKGQIWRLFTFIFFPELSSIDVISVLFFALKLYVYYMIGNSLENVWGAFRFNLYYISGVVLSVVAGFIVSITTGISYWPVGFEYIDQALFLAFATIFPNMQFLIFYILPVKAKWLGIVYAALMGFEILGLVSSRSTIGYAYATAIVISMLNFLIYFLSTRNMKRYSYKERKRKAEFRRNVGPKVVPIYRHRCAVCGRTEKDNENLEFRFCSKCDGNYEYCADHIYTHEHVHK